MKILEALNLQSSLGKKSIAVLIDPDKIAEAAQLEPLLRLADENCVDYFFVGGSLVTTTNLADVVKTIKDNVSIPVVFISRQCPSD